MDKRVVLSEKHRIIYTIMSSVNSPTTLLTAPFHRDLGGNIANYESSQKPMAGGRKSAKKSNKKSSNKKLKTTKRKTTKRKTTKRKTTKRWFGLL